MTVHKAKGLEFPVVVFPFANYKASSDRETRRWVQLEANAFEGLPVANISMSKENYDLFDGQFPAYSDAYERYKREVLFDSYNLLYVALTRPVERLYVVSQFAKLGNSTINQFLIQFLSEEHTVEPEVAYTFGNCTSPVSEGQKEQSDIDKRPEPRSLDKFISNNWRSRVRLSRSIDGPGDQIANQPRKWGNMVHDLLARTKNAEDVEKVVRREVAAGKLPEDIAGQMQDILKTVTGHPALADCFNCDEYYVERDWLGNGEIQRPDRISRNGNQWTVLDYKTGEEKSSHVEQIRGYAQMLLNRGMNVQAKLVYIGEDVQVKDINLTSDPGEQLTLL